jgi:hypothetical protein
MLFDSSHPLHKSQATQQEYHGSMTAVRSLLIFDWMCELQMLCYLCSACCTGFSKNFFSPLGLEILVLGLVFHPSSPYDYEGIVGADPSDTSGMPESRSLDTAADNSKRPGTLGKAYDHALCPTSYRGHRLICGCDGCYCSRSWCTRCLLGVAAVVLAPVVEPTLVLVRPSVIDSMLLLLPLLYVGSL